MYKCDCWYDYEYDCGFGGNSLHDENDGYGKIGDGCVICAIVGIHTIMLMLKSMLMLMKWLYGLYEVSIIMILTQYIRIYEFDYSLFF